jgi:Na+/proline symporter
MKSFVKQTFGFLSIVFALIALELGGSMMLGTCQEAYSSGLFGLLYVVGISCGFLLLGFGFARKMKAMGVESTIDLFEVKYRSPFIRTCASILSTITVWGLLIGQIVAAKSLIHSLGYNSDAIFITLMIGIIIYAILGGLSAAGVTYQAQLAYTVVVFGGIFAFCLAKEPPTFLVNLFLNRTLCPPNTIAFSTIFASLVMPALYYITDQEFAQPLFDISNKTISAASAISASLFMLIFSLVPIYFGIKAKALNLIIPAGDSPLIPVLKVLTNEWVAWLAVLGMAAALIAMIDYYLWSISLSITQELSIAFNLPRQNSKLDKIMVFLVGIGALAATYCTTSSAVQVLLFSYELYDSCLIVPLLMSYFQPDLKKGSAIGSILFGLGGFILFQVITVPFSGQIVSLCLSFCGFYIGGYVEKALTRTLGYRQSNTCSAS